MNKIHLLSRLNAIALRGFVVAGFAFFSTVAYAQTPLTNLVDTQTAVDRLSSHYPSIQAAFDSMNPNASNYAFEAARVELTMHVFEDVQQGVEPEATLQIRFDEGMGQPAPGGRPTLDDAAAAGNAPPVAEYDPIVAELVNLLKQ